MPRWWLRLRSWIVAIIERRRLNDELDEELQFHRDHSEQMYRSQGMAPDAARRAATLDLDGITTPRYGSRDARGTRSLEELWRDVVIATRGLRHLRGFTVTVTGTVAVGMALVVAASIIARSYLLDPLPAPGSERLFHVWYSGPSGPAVNGGARSEPQHLHQLDWSRLSDVVEMADASVFARYTATDGASARELVGLRVTEDAADDLGVSIAAGRTFSHDDFVSGRPAILLSHHLWKDRYGGDLGVIGRTISLGATGTTLPDVTYQVIGVTAPGFRYVREFSRAAVDVVTTASGPATVYMIRLREGVPVEDAARRISTTIRETPAIVVPDGWPGVRLESVYERFVGPVRPVLTAVWLATWCVLALVAANGAILVLLRSLRRQREAMVRITLGASRWHLLRSFGVEATLVTLTASALGLLGAQLVLTPLRPVLSQVFGRVPPGGTASVLSTDILLGAGAFVIVTVAGWTLLGALAIRRASSAAFRDVRGTTDRPAVRITRTGFMVVQAAVSVALVTGCALMIRSATSLLTVDLGMQIDHTWRSRLALPAAGFPDVDSKQQFYERLVHVASDEGLVVGFANWPLFVEAARPQPVEVAAEPNVTVRAAVTAVSAGYFEALGIPTINGRALSAQDRVGAAPVAVVSASFAARTWPGQTAVGQQLRTTESATSGAAFGPWHTVVGIVGDVRQVPDDEDQQDVYVSTLQRVPPQYAVVVMRRRDGPDAAGFTEAEAVRRFERLSGKVDARAIVGTVTPLTTEFNKLVATPHLLATLLTGFGAFATVLTMIGLYGVTAHAVRQRESELAIRTALGASRTHIATRLLGSVIVVLGVGSGIGLLASVGLGRLLATQLFSVSAFDLTLSGLVVIGTAVCLLAATALPIRRAVRIAPARLLRDL